MRCVPCVYFSNISWLSDPYKPQKRQPINPIWNKRNGTRRRVELSVRLAPVIALQAHFHVELKQEQPNSQDPFWPAHNTLCERLPAFFPTIWTPHRARIQHRKENLLFLTRIVHLISTLTCFPLPIRISFHPRKAIQSLLNYVFFLPFILRRSSVSSFNTQKHSVECTRREAFLLVSCNITRVSYIFLLLLLYVVHYTPLASQLQLFD